MGCKKLSKEYYLTKTENPFLLNSRLSGSTSKKNNANIAFPNTVAKSRYKPVFHRAIYGLRYYNSKLGRWINRDPIGEKGGLNIYAFVYNNAVNQWDYLGLWRSGEHKNLTRISFARVYDRTEASYLNDILEILKNENVEIDSGTSKNQNKWHFTRDLKGNINAATAEYSSNLATEISKFNSKLASVNSNSDFPICKETLKILGRLSHAWQDYYAHAIELLSPFRGDPGEITGNPDAIGTLMKPASWGGLSNWGEHGFQEPAWRRPDDGSNRGNKAIDFVSAKYQIHLKAWMLKCKCAFIENED